MSGSVLQMMEAGVPGLLGPLSLQLEGQGITMIMGPNGAGKSLFLRLAQGLLPGGRVTWDGAPAAQTMPRRGVVFQASPVLRRSVAANVAFPLLAQGVGAAARRERVRRALVDVRLETLADAPAARLSGGERQRMALARALITEPEVLLLDEPSASLDPASTAALERVISAAAQAGTKIVMATHDIGQARRLADELLFLIAGKLVAQAPAATALDVPSHPGVADYLAGRLPRSSPHAGRQDSE